MARHLAWIFAAVMGLMPSVAAAFEERPVALGALHGTLTLPSGTAAVPAALILPGSGPVDRDGNLPQARSNTLKLLAQDLAAKGIASLRIDKRGVGQSQPADLREEDLRFSTYVEDATAWLDRLAAEPRVARIFLIGHSEGALVATQVAAGATPRHPVTGVILVAGAGFPAAQLIGRQLAAAGVPATLQQRSAAIADALTRQQAVNDPPPELAALYRRSVQPYLMSWLPLDPAQELGRVEMPVLILQGTTDLQVAPEDARRLAAHRPGAALVLVEGMNHVLKVAPAERAANLATYAQPEVPLAPSLVPAIATFMANH